MPEPDHSSPSASSSSHAPPRTNRGSTSEASSSSSSSSPATTRFREEEEDRYRQEFRENHVIEEHHQYEVQLQQQHEDRNDVVSFRGNFFDVDDSSVIRDDTWSCIIVVLTFWFFVSMTLILGVYGPATLSLGPNSSILIEPSPIFVQSVKVRELDDSDSNVGLMLYEFYKTPSLDVVKTWSQNHTATVPVGSHKEWTYYLNEGSEINISYSVNSQGSSVFLVIAQGSEGLTQWLEDPTYPNTTLSWNVIHGNGSVSQKIVQAATYYVAVGNLNSEDIEVELNVRVESMMYNTSEAYYNCDFTDGECSVRILFPNGNSVVISSSDQDQNSSSSEVYVKINYGPRWAIYVVGIAGMTTLMLVAFNFLNKFRCGRGEETGQHYVDTEAERAPLLSYKDDETSSWGSSYDSQSSNEEDLNHEFLYEGKVIRDGEDGNNTRRLCAICFDAPRDCFFLPCGHCVACFACGTRIAEAGGTCPVCRRTMRKVRKIFTV